MRRIEPDPIAYFGEPPAGLAPIGEKVEPTPVGETCPMCSERIEADDYGRWLGHFDAGGASIRPNHFECIAAATFGGPEHVVPILTGAPEGTVCEPPGSCQEGYADRRALGRAIVEELAAYVFRRRLEMGEGDDVR